MANIDSGETRDAHLMAMEEDRKHWHLDRRLPIAIIGAILLQTFAIGWWAASTSSRVTAVELAATAAKAEVLRAETAAQIRLAAIESRQLDADKLGVRVDERLKAVAESLQRVENALAPRAPPPR